MKILAIDTTGEKLYALVISDGARYFRISETGKRGHSAALMLAVDSLLSEAGLNVEELDAVAAVVGPGSFTGIRIGVAAATAIAYATGAKRIAVNTFEILAYNRSNARLKIDAGHGNLYTAECADGAVTATRFMTSEEASQARDFESEPVCPREEALAGTVERVAAEGNFAVAFQPFYMRKPQAERNIDEI